MPQFAVLIYATESLHDAEATPEDLSECDAYAEQLVDEGVMSFAFALSPRELAVTVREDGARRAPYHEHADIVAGFYVIDAVDLHAVVELVRRDPAVISGGGVEIRPVHSGGIAEAGGARR